MLMENATANTVNYGTTGSKMDFYLALNVLGLEPWYSFRCKSKEYDNGKQVILDWTWVDEEYKKPILTREEFYSKTYDDFLDQLFQELNSKVVKEKRYYD